MVRDFFYERMRKKSHPFMGRRRDSGWWKRI